MLLLVTFHTIMSSLRTAQYARLGCNDARMNGLYHSLYGTRRTIQNTNRIEY